MQILLAILIAAAASKVQSTGFVCSKFPLLSNLYSSALEISSWNITLEETKTSTDRTLLQQMADYITSFKNKYELAKNEVDCKPILCKLRYQLLPNNIDAGKIESFIPQEYRVVLEDYLEQLGRGVFNLSSAYCQAAGKKIQEIVDLASLLKDKLAEIHADVSDFNYFDMTDIINELNAEIIRKFDGADKFKCRYLNLRNTRCIDHHFLSSYYFELLPQALQNQLNYFVENCTKIKHELESMKGPGIGC